MSGRVLRLMQCIRARDSTLDLDQLIGIKLFLDHTKYLPVFVASHPLTPPPPASRL